MLCFHKTTISSHLVLALYFGLPLLNELTLVRLNFIYALRFANCVCSHRTLILSLMTIILQLQLGPLSQISEQYHCRGCLNTEVLLPFRDVNCQHDLQTSVVMG